MALKDRVLTKFPARVLASTGVAVTLENSVYNFASQWSDFTESLVVPDSAITEIPYFQRGATADDDIYGSLSINLFYGSIATVGTLTSGTWHATTIEAAYGGTGFSSYAVGDILYANTTSTLAKLADIATGNALISGGVGVAPAWGKVGLSTHVTGNLPVANLNSGTLASATTFWRGDGTWSTPAGGGDVIGPASSSPNAAVRFDLNTGKLVKNSALIIADTTGALMRTGAGGISVEGTNTNDNAAAAFKGEYISSNLAAGSAVSLVTSTGKTVTSISLTAGDWDVQGMVSFTSTATTSITLLGAYITDVNDGLPTAPNTASTGFGGGGMITVRTPAYVSGSTNAAQLPTGNIRISLSSTTTIYLTAVAGFSASTLTAFGHLGARRAR